MKSETLDMDFQGKNFCDYVYHYDMPAIERHFQEGIVYHQINFFLFVECS